MNWHPTPFPRLMLPFAAGIGLAVWLERDLPVPGVWLAVSATAAMLLARRKYKFGTRWVFGLVLQIFLLLFGFAQARRHDERSAETHFAHNKGHPPKLLIGTLSETPTRGTRLRTRLRLEASVDSAGTVRPCSGNLLLYLETSPENERLRYGDRVFVRTKVQPIQPSQNPYAFDYQRYLHFQNIHFQAFVKPDSLQLLAARQGNTIWQSAADSHERLLALLREHFRTPDEFAVAAALLIGHKDELSEEVRAAYAETGSIHALVVSGSHVMAVFAGVLLVLRRLPMRVRLARFAEPLVALLLVWGFTFLTGATASVVRAAMMASIYAIGRAGFRQVSGWNVLAATAFIQLIVNPFWLFDAGFQLSYAAVAGIGFFYPKLLRGTPAPKNGALRWMRSALLVGVAAQVGTLPLGLFYFHQFPLWFWLSGWVVLCGGSLFLAGGFLLAVFSGWVPLLAQGLGFLLYHWVWGMNKLIFGIQKLPFGLVEGIWLTAWGAVLLYAALGAFSAAFEQKKPRWLLVGLVFLTACFWGRAVHSIEHLGQRKVVVYNLSRHSLVDFFDGENLVSLSDSVPDKQVRFSALTNRQASRVQLEQGFVFGKDSVFRGQNLLWQPPFVQFFEQKIAVVDDDKWLKNSDLPPVAVDFVLLRANPRVSLAACAERFGCRAFVFDASNAWGRVEKWKEECRTEGFSCHDVREQGAWVLEF